RLPPRPRIAQHGLRHADDVPATHPAVRPGPRLYFLFALSRSRHRRPTCSPPAPSYRRPAVPSLVHSKLKLQTKTTYAHPEPLCVVLVSTPALLRVAHLDPHPLRAAPVLIALFAGAAFAGGLWTATKLALIKQFVRKPELHTPVLLWFSASSAADVGITVGLVWTLTHRKTGFVATDSVIDKIIWTTTQTGLLDLQRAGHHLLHGLPAPRAKLRLGPPPLQALLQRAALDAQRACGAREHVGLARAVWVGRALRAARHAHGDAHGAARTQTETPSLTTKFEEFDDLDGDEQVRALDVRELGACGGRRSRKLRRRRGVRGRGRGRVGVEDHEEYGDGKEYGDDVE
ncbi:hypothetical protein K438DRAFT_1874959, partial [Mycena galopus ATCC 62051]